MAGWGLDNQNNSPVVEPNGGVVSKGPDLFLLPRGCRASALLIPCGCLHGGARKTSSNTWFVTMVWTD